MQCLFIRHGDKSWESDQSEVGLSPRGHGQAQNFAHLVLNKKLPKPNQLLTSPLLRAKETLLPLSAQCLVPLLPDPNLLLQLEHEPTSQFLKRVESFFTNTLFFHPKIDLDWTIYICSHQDWLSHAAEIIQNYTPEKTKSFFWPTGQYYLFKIDSSKSCELLNEGRVMWS